MKVIFSTSTISLPSLHRFKAVYNPQNSWLFYSNVQFELFYTSALHCPQLSVKCVPKICQRNVAQLIITKGQRQFKSLEQCTCVLNLTFLWHNLAVRLTDLMSRSRSSTSNVCGFMWFKYSNCFNKAWWSTAMSIQGVIDKKMKPYTDTKQHFLYKQFPFNVPFQLQLNSIKIKYKFCCKHTISTFKVLLGLNESPQSVHLLPLQLIQFSSDMMANKVQLFGQFTLLYFFMNDGKVSVIQQLCSQQ